MPESIEGRLAIAVLQEQMKEVKTDIQKANDGIRDMNSTVENGFKELNAKIDAQEGKFAGKLTEKIVYAMIALILIAFFGVLTAMVFDNRSQVEQGGKGDQQGTQTEAQPSSSQEPDPPAVFTQPEGVQSPSTTGQTPKSHNNNTGGGGQQPAQQPPSTSGNDDEGGILDTIRGIFR